LKAYFDAPVPEHLTAEAVTSTKGATQIVKLGKGSFKLGASQFEDPTQGMGKRPAALQQTVSRVSAERQISVITYQLFDPG